MACGSGEVVVCHDERLERLARPALGGAHHALVEAAAGGRGHARWASRRRASPCWRRCWTRCPRTSSSTSSSSATASTTEASRAEVAELVATPGPRPSGWCISSFNPLCLVRLAAVRPALRRGFLIDPDKPWFLQAYVVSPLVSSHSVHPHPRGVHAGARGGVARSGTAAWRRGRWMTPSARGRCASWASPTSSPTGPRVVREALRTPAPDASARSPGRAWC